MSRTTTPAQQAFAGHVRSGMTPVDAATAAGFQARDMKKCAYQLMHNPRVQALIGPTANQKTGISANVQEPSDVDAEKVLMDWWGIHSTYVDELVEYRRNACRYCHGTHFRYQRTPEEFRKDQDKHTAAVAAAIIASKPAPKFDRQGGPGYNPKKAPNKRCPECHGDGDSQVFIKDTRQLSSQARRLYAGIKVTASGGMEVLLRNQDSALQMVAKHLGMLIDRSERGKPGEFQGKSREQIGEMLVERLTKSGVTEDVARRIVGLSGS